MTHPLLAPTACLQARLDRLRVALSAAGLDALVVTHPPNVFYLTNFASSSSMAVVTAGQVYLLADSRYTSALDLLIDAGGGPAITPLPVVGAYDEVLVRWLVAQGSGWRVGFEGSHVSVRRHARLASRLADLAPDADRPVGLVDTDGLVEAGRLVKDRHEIACLREAARRLSVVARQILTRAVRPGVSEHDLAAEIDHRLRHVGFARPAFETIVAGGPNSALPHATPTGRRIGHGDLVLLDFGGVYGGYCVDLTRTVVAGTPGEDARQLYRAVARAQDAAIAAVRPGVLADQVDSAARAALAASGLEEAFGHATGHGLGLEVHEAPRIGARSPGTPAPALLAPGMVVTIEPGAYVAGVGGVRLEDDILVTLDGAERLTDVPRDGRLQ
jgi:Xaa-Pro aminopeptidase